MDSRPHVVICVPVYGTVSATFFQSFIRFFTYNQNHSDFRLDAIIRQGLYVDHVRNSLAQAALDANADYIFWMDSDNIVSPKTIERLLKVINTHNADLAAGIYFEKGKPYYPVLREYRNGRFFKIEDIPIGEVIEVGAAGMGCTLIKADVFKELEFPWFKTEYIDYDYGERKLIGEDVYMCKKMLDNKMKIVCDTSTISGHFGAGVDAFGFLSTENIRKEYKSDRDEMTDDIAEFFKIDRDLAERQIIASDLRLTEAWNKAKPKTPDEERKFYKETDRYVFELAMWHFSSRRDFDVNLVDKIKMDKSKTVLDYGCGTGQNAFILARNGFDVTLADLDSVSLKFAEFRFKKHALPYKIWHVDKDPRPKEKYDTILAFDVFEHIPPRELPQTVRDLIKLKHDKTRIYYTTNFNKTKEFPMHHEASAFCEKCGSVVKGNNSKSGQIFMCDCKTVKAPQLPPTYWTDQKKLIQNLLNEHG